MHELLAPILFVLSSDSLVFAHLVEQEEARPCDALFHALFNREYLEHDA
jgi:hypothetical protein